MSALSKPGAASERGQVGAVIVAAGSSSRMRGVDKIFAPLAGAPLLSHTVSAFERCDAVDQIAVVLSAPNLEQGRALVARHGWRKIICVCEGGVRRQDSVKAGLDQLPECEWVLIHDGARPFVDEAMIERGLAAARESGAAIAAVPVKDTIKMGDPAGFVRETLNRQNLWVVQTPQVFRWSLLMGAYAAGDADATDDASLVERAGGRVKLFVGAECNIKVTTPEDLLLAEVLVARRAAGGAE